MLVVQMSVSYSAGAESSHSLHIGKDAAIVRSETEGFISDGYKDTEADGQHKQEGQNQRKPDEAEKQLRHLHVEDEMKQEEKPFVMEAGAQGELRVTVPEPSKCIAMHAGFCETVTNLSICVCKSKMCSRERCSSPLLGVSVLCHVDGFFAGMLGDVTGTSLQPF